MELERLKAATKDNTIIFNIDSSLKAKIIDVYDGDTFTAAVVLPLNNVFPGTQCSNCNNTSLFSYPIGFKCRLSGIDTPELRTKNAHEKILGYMARDKVRQLVLNKMVTLQTWGFDKYGRLLVTAFEETAGDIGLCLIGSKLAVEYDGGTKKYDWGSHTLSND